MNERRGLSFLLYSNLDNVQKDIGQIAENKNDKRQDEKKHFKVYRKNNILENSEK